MNQIIHHKFEKKHKRKVERVISEKQINKSQYSWCQINSVLSRILGYALSQLRSMGPRWNFWRLILDLNSKFWKKIFYDRSLRKNFFFWPPGKFFLCLVIFHFLEFNSKLHRISSTDFKFHLKICIRSGVITFWTFARILTTCSKNSKRYNS